VYAGTEVDSLFKSTDAGATWVASSFGMEGESIRSFAIDRQTPSRLFAGTAATLVTARIYRSTDAGATWVNVTAAITLEGHVTALAIHPNEPAIVYAGVGGGGVYRTSDSGGTWIPANVGLTNRQVHALDIDPLDPEVMYVGTLDGVFKTTTGGGTWFPASAGLAHPFVSSLVIHPSSPSTLYAGTDGGVYRSVDGGVSWTAVNHGLVLRRIQALALDPTRPTTVYAGLQYGSVWQSTPPVPIELVGFAVE
jgi:photosystem II stability/assembly factor-like uncharacterized protein